MMLRSIKFRRGIIIQSSSNTTNNFHLLKCKKNVIHQNKTMMLKYYLSSTSNNNNNKDDVSSPRNVGLDISKIPEIPLENIRNFSIIAHVDHGKSTLSDRILEYTGNIDPNTNAKQLLDTLDVEKERGITVKAQSVTMIYNHQEDDHVSSSKDKNSSNDDTSNKENNYLLNLIDTPGHVDFSFEVLRSLNACDGALLLVDSTQGVEAQTIANYRIANKANLKVIPCLTKLDLPHADPAMALEQIESAFGIEEDDVIWTSAKTGEGTDDVLKALVKRLDPPQGDYESKFQCKIVDSWHNQYRGIVTLINISHGSIKKGDKIAMMSTKKKFEVLELGFLSPTPIETNELKAGQVGYLISGIKDTKDILAGDTIVMEDMLNSPELLNDIEIVQPSKPMLYASVYPTVSSEFENLKKSLNRLLLNDVSVHVSSESSGALGQGFRCGFLGKLHMEVFFQRLHDEFDADVISTAPMVPFEAVLKDGTITLVEKPADLPDSKEVEKYMEPMAMVTVVTPPTYVGSMMESLQSRRGVQDSMSTLDVNTTIIKYKLPWQEIVIDLYDEIKSRSSGYASFDYEEIEPEAANIVRVDMLLNGSPVDALSFVCHRTMAEQRGRDVAMRLKNVIDRQQYEVVIQAAVGAKVLAKERIAPYRKNVLVKSGKNVGGGDVTRKKKLLEKQKKGKKRMKMIGNVQVKQEAFMTVMSRKK